MAALEITGPSEFIVGDGDHWRNHAVCTDRISLFFPPRSERPQARARRERHALRLCNSCPVIAQCQAFARSNHEYGFWGGESEEERHLAGYTVSAPIGIRTRLSLAPDHQPT